MAIYSDDGENVLIKDTSGLVHVIESDRVVTSAKKDYEDRKQWIQDASPKKNAQGPPAPVVLGLSAPASASGWAPDAIGESKRRDADRLGGWVPSIIGHR